jgi:hypothetical protein
MTYRIFQILGGDKHDAGPERFDEIEEAHDFIATSFDILRVDHDYDSSTHGYIAHVIGTSPNGTTMQFDIEQEPEIARHYFDATGDAYDATQCRESIKTGDVLIVMEDGADDSDDDERATVVGLAWAWPIAITKDAGHLHSLDDKPDSLDVIMADAKFTDAQIRQAVFEARWLGCELHPAFAAYCDGPRRSEARA